MGIITDENREKVELTEEILHINIGRAIKYKRLVEKSSRELKAQNIEATIRSLEKKGHLYIERNPRVVDGRVRTNLLPTDIIYFDTFPKIKRQTLLYKTGVEYGDHTINHVLGCAHGCNYPCYAMQISKRYGRISDYDDWMHPRIVGNALDLLEKEIPKLNSKIKFVHLSFMTDPFMYDAVNKRTLPWVQNLTLKIIRRLNEENIKVTSLTKGLLPIELKQEKCNKDNEYGITLVSLDSKFHKRYEPFSPSGDDRLKSLKNLHDAGLKTWVSLEPYPTPNIVKQELTDLLDKVSFVDKLIFGKWNYNPEVNGFETSKTFYTKCSDTVIDFCRQNDIALHIKDQTPKSSSKTQDLFK